MGGPGGGFCPGESPLSSKPAHSLSDQIHLNLPNSPSRPDLHSRSADVRHVLPRTVNTPLTAGSSWRVTLGRPKLVQPVAAQGCNAPAAFPLRLRATAADCCPDRRPYRLHPPLSCDISVHLCIRRRTGSPPNPASHCRPCPLSSLSHPSHRCTMAHPQQDGLAANPASSQLMPLRP